MRISQFNELQIECALASSATVMRSVRPQSMYQYVYSTNTQLSAPRTFAYGMHKSGGEPEKCEVCEHNVGSGGRVVASHVGSGFRVNAESV